MPTFSVVSPLPNWVGVSQVAGGGLPLTMSGPFYEFSGDNYVALAGGGKSGATQITTQTSRIVTVATAGDSVLLPPAISGYEILVVNHGANSMQVFGQGNDTIDDVATGTGVSQMAQSLVIYTCATTGAWYSEGLATGYVKGQGLQTFQYTTLAASTTNTQVAGTPVTAMINAVTLTSNPGAVTLPVSQPGMSIQIAATTAADALSVFPNAGGTGTETINALAANAAISMAALSSATFVCVVAGQWWTIPRVPS